MSEQVRQDLFGLAIAGLVCAAPVLFIGVAVGVGPEAVLLGTGSSFAGMMAAGLVWMAGGRPPADRLHKDHRLLLAVCIALFVAGLIPAITWQT